MSKWRRVDGCTCGPNRKEHADVCPVVKMIEDVHFGIGAINDPDVLGAEGKRRLFDVAAKLASMDDEIDEPEYAEDEYNGRIPGR